MEEEVTPQALSKGRGSGGGQSVDSAVELGEGGEGEAPAGGSRGKGHVPWRTGQQGREDNLCGEHYGSIDERDVL